MVDRLVTVFVTHDLLYRLERPNCFFEERFAELEEGRAQWSLIADACQRLVMEVILYSYLLPGHHLGDGHRPTEDESSTVSREILPRELRLGELLYIRCKVVW